MTLRCPQCWDPKRVKVYDTRTSPDKDVVKRRRECSCCGYRWTTLERNPTVLRPAKAVPALTKAESL
jgi:transcriptional regulator NrdR family protein